MDNLLHDDSLDEMFGIPSALSIALYMGAIATEEVNNQSNIQDDNSLSSAQTLLLVYYLYLG